MTDSLIHPTSPRPIPIRRAAGAVVPHVRRTIGLVAGLVARLGDRLAGPPIRPVPALVPARVPVRGRGPVSATRRRILRPGPGRR